jgi:hypothetical protein
MSLSRLAAATEAKGDLDALCRELPVTACDRP